jgi:hypothetical protein
MNITYNSFSLIPFLDSKFTEALQENLTGRYFNWSGRGAAAIIIIIIPLVNTASNHRITSSNTVLSDLLIAAAIF